jgi:hypothetical protein
MKPRGAFGKGEEQKDEERLMNKEFLQGKDLSQQMEFGRPEIPSMLDDKRDQIEFMQIDCDYYTARPQNQFTKEDDEKADTGKPVIRLFGVNSLGNSVAAHIHNFSSYFYIHIIEEI